MRVLIVDDNQAMRRTVKAIIQDLVEEIDECSRGAEALEHFASFSPDWVLMDIKMSDLDGLTATREIKRLFPAARVVIVTSYDEPSLREEAQAAGACGYVLKDNLRSLCDLLTLSRSD
jgi:CheY-like chemotaxis protein